MTKDEELSLIQRSRTGDAAAFELIVRQHEKLLYNLALRTLHSPEDAADAVQEAFLKAYTGLAKFRGDGALSAWLCRILNNVCMDALRRRKDAVSLTAEDAQGERSEQEIPDERFDPAAILERKDLNARVRVAVELLPTDFRQPLLLREFAELSYGEIGQILGLDMGTVKTRIFRARKKLCAILSDEGNFSEKTPSKKAEGGARK